VFVGTVRDEGVCLHDKKVFFFTIRIGMLHMSKGLQRTGHFSWDKAVRNKYRILGEKTSRRILTN